MIQVRAFRVAAAAVVRPAERCRRASHDTATGFRLPPRSERRRAASAAAQRAPPRSERRRAASAIERLICSDVDLAAGDRRVGLLFAEARCEPGGQARPLIDEQRAWLKERDEYDSADALHTLYVHRERALILD